jgi:chorismate mutase/prephenate dehydratase
MQTELTAAYLGPAGTFCEEAAVRFFGAKAKTVPCRDFDAVLDAVERGEADCGVIAIENINNGTVTHALDLLLERPLRIVGEVLVPVEHCLLTQSGTIDGIKTVYAHAQALGQCRHWLDAHLPDAKRQAVDSNAEGARLASLDASAAGIASARAGEIYGLRAAFRSIQDGKANRTRFLVMSREARDFGLAGKPFKTSIVFTVRNVPGALYRVLYPLAEQGVQMCRIESRPARNGHWEYNFFIDLEGRTDEPRVAAALGEMEKESAQFRILGSYPVLGE